MNDHQRTDRLDQRTAEWLLDGAAAPGRPAADARDHEALRDLLCAAAAPARPGEFAGEDAAAEAFCAARSARTAHASRRRRLMTLVPHFVTVKIAVGAVVVAAFGGVAIAAGTGNLPGQDTTPKPTHSVPKIVKDEHGSRSTPGSPASPMTGSPTPTTRPSPPKRGKSEQHGHEGDRGDKRGKHRNRWPKRTKYPRHSHNRDGNDFTGPGSDNQPRYFGGTPDNRSGDGSRRSDGGRVPDGSNDSGGGYWNFGTPNMNTGRSGPSSP